MRTKLGSQVSQFTKYMSVRARGGEALGLLQTVFIHSSIDMKIEEAYLHTQ